MRKSIVYLLLGFAAVVWGASFIITKELFTSEAYITVLHILTFRLCLASAVTIPVLLLFRRLERIRKGDLVWFLLLALFEPFAYSICETSGVRLVSGSMAAIVVATIPLFVPFGMAAFYHEKVRPVTLVGILLSLVGLAVMTFLGGGQREDSSPLGLAFLAGAVAIAVGYTVVLVRLVRRYRPFTITAYQNLFSCLYFLPLMLLIDGEALPLLSYSPKMLLLLLTLGVFCSTVAYAFYNIGVARLGASAACIFTNVIPVFSFLTALAVGQEHFFWSKPVGILIVLAGVVLAQLPPRQRQ